MSRAGNLGTVFVQFLLTVAEHAFDYGEDKAFAEIHHVFVIGVGDLGFDHPKFSQVATRF